jgi:hypothetical protein
MHTGIKTHTRRLWTKPHCKIGGTYAVTHKMMYHPEDVVGTLYVEDMYKQPIGMMTEHDAINEGGYDLWSYKKVLMEIQKINMGEALLMMDSPWVIKFRFVLSDLIDGNGGTVMIDEYRDEWREHMKKYGLVV